MARSLNVREFGVIAIGLAFLPLMVAGLRGFVFEPVVIHADLSRGTARRVLTDSAVAGLVAGSLMFVVVVVLHGPTVLAAILFLGAVGMMVEEGARWILFGLDAPRTGAILDVTWALLQVGALAISFRSPTVAGLGWTAGAIVSATVGCLAVLRITEVRPWTPPRRVWQWGLEYVVAAGSLQLAILIAPLTGGVGVAGGLRGAASLLGGVTIILGGAQQAVVGRLRLIKDPGTLRQWGVRIGLALGLIASLLSLPLLGISDSLGRGLLGDTWSVTRMVLPILIVQRIATAVMCGPAFVLRKVAGHTAGAWWRIGLTVTTLVGVIVGAHIGSEEGAALALTVGAVVSIPIWMRMLWSASYESGNDYSSPTHSLMGDAGAARPRSNDDGES